MKHVVITGANRGIGLELTRLYAQTCRVFALCRQSSEALDSLKQVEVIEDVELTSQSSIQGAIDKCSDHIDILINNAGILRRVSLNQITKGDMDSIKDQFNINALAPLLVVQTAVSKLNKGAKVALITSRMGSISDNSSGGQYGYRMSKAALNAAGKSLAIDLKPAGVAVGIFHPGWVKTRMTNFTGHYDAKQSASELMGKIDSLSLSNSGIFLHANGEHISW